jgi:methylmalonyl-CoA mutase
MEKKTEESLFSSFPVPSFGEWIKSASAEIAGADPLEKLSWESSQLQFAPIYTAEYVAAMGTTPPVVLGNSHQARSWTNMPLVTVDDEKSANEIALEHLRNEADGILFRLSSRNHDFTKLLRGISWEHCSVSFIAKHGVSDDLVDFIRNKVDFSKITGTYFTEVPNPGSAFPDTNFKFHGIIINPSTPVDELAEALVKGVKVIEVATENRKALSETVRHIAFQLPLGTELLVEIAKFRAMRRLWYQAVSAYGVEGYSLSDVYLHGFSDVWVDPKFQPHGNMLKSTIASIAGISGGCNAITNLPEEENNRMMTRVARNTSHILLAESHFGKVNDPFGGAYAVEKLTNDFASRAWKKFQELL